jgi:polyisoprenyl-phosphate glycosyltransferase
VIEMNVREKTSQGPVISVVSPVHNEGAGVEEFVRAVVQQLEATEPAFEIVLVDDGSQDDSWSRITVLAARDPRVVGLSLSRNFGKEAAMRAGLDASRGRAVIVMDSDLQHPPDVLPELIDRWRDGAEVVEAVKRTRTDQSWPGRIAARSFNRLFSWMTDVDLADATDFRLLSRPAADALLGLPERSSFFRGTSTWIGFERARVDFDVGARRSGDTKWTARALLRMAIDAITSFTAAPLQLVTIVGVTFAVFAAGLGIQTLWRWASGAAVQGFTTIILLLLIQGTFVLLGLGIIGQYLARTHDEVKARPTYIVGRRTDAPIEESRTSATADHPWSPGTNEDGDAGRRGLAGPPP